MRNGKVRIYGCGGCGLNLASNFVSLQSSEHYADVSTTFIDTSRSNLNDSIPDESIFIIPDVDGSGKIRAENSTAIQQQIKPLLLKHAPETFNIVMFSGAGGSGSVVGPLVINELLERGETVVAIVVGAYESKISCRNTLNTLKTLDRVSEQHDKPVVMHFVNTTPEVHRTDIDRDVVRTVSSVLTLCAASNKALDSRDLSTWVNYTRATEVPAQLALLNTFTHDEMDALGEIDVPISVACLLNEEDTPHLPHAPDYECTGYRQYADKAETVPDVYAVIHTQGLQEVQKFIGGELKRYEEQERSRDNTRTGFLSGDEKNTDGVLVL